jgi:hypothetical protein
MGLDTMALKDTCRNTQFYLQGYLSHRRSFDSSSAWIATKIEESSNLSPRIRNALICMGIWFYPKLNSFIYLANTRIAP